MNNFAFPYAFLLLFLPYIWRRLLPAVKGIHGDALKVPFIEDLKRISVKSGEVWSGGISSNEHEAWGTKLWALFAIWTLLVIALARPQWIGEPHPIKTESRDIMLVTDISTSMLAQDFSYQNHRLDRLTAVKLAAIDFIEKRANDRIGLILFGTRAYLQAPLTFDKQAVKKILATMDAGMAGDSTSIGDAMGLALKNLRKAPKSQNKVIILLTDGENNDGSLSLPQAIKLAEEEGFKVYTIGVGAPNSFLGMFISGNSGLDEQGLKALAQATKGKYFRAESTGELQQVYNLIDKLEPDKTEARIVREVKELYYIPLSLAIGLSILLMLLWRRNL